MTVDPLLSAVPNGRCAQDRAQNSGCDPSPEPSVLGTDCGFTRSSEGFLTTRKLSHEATSTHSSSYPSRTSPQALSTPTAQRPSGSPPRDPCPCSASSPDSRARHQAWQVLLPSLPSGCSLTQVTAAIAGHPPATKCQQPSRVIPGPGLS